MTLPRAAGLVLAAILAACGSGSGRTTPTPGSPTPAAAPAAALPPSGGVVYAALGASETFGVGADPVTSGYAYRLRDALHLDAGTFVDVGVPGITVANAFESELANALTIRPTVCTTFFGINDIRNGVALTHFRAALTDLVSTLRRGGCQVLIIGLPELGDLPALRLLGGPTLSLIARDWNGAMRQVAATTGSAFLALDQLSQELVAHPELISGDGLHPSNAGHQRLAEVILAALREARFVPG